MNSRERVVAAIERSGLDRIPLADSFWEDTITRWQDEGLPVDMAPADYFDFDIADLSIDPSPRFPAELLAEGDETYTMRDRFGYVATKQRGKSRTIDYLSHAVPDRAAWPAVQQRFALAADEPSRIDTTAFPFRLEPDITWEEARTRAAAQRRQQKYVLANAYGPHETVWRLRGFTPALIDLVDDPGFVAEIAGTYMDFLIAVIDRCLTEGIRPDGFLLAEDLASRRGMLFSPQVWRTLYKPHIARLGAFLADRGLHFWMHTCGNAEVVYPDLIECGLQVINPLEAKSGLDVRVLNKTFGDRLAFYGNIDVITMAHSAPAIEAEIRDKLAAFDARGGYVFHSDHSVPPEVSFGRYCFIVDCIRKYGSF